MFIRMQFEKIAGGFFYRLVRFQNGTGNPKLPGAGRNDEGQPPAVTQEDDTSIPSVQLA